MNRRMMAFAAIGAAVVLSVSASAQTTGPGSAQGGCAIQPGNVWHGIAGRGGLRQRQRSRGGDRRSWRPCRRGWHRCRTVQRFKHGYNQGRRLGHLRRTEHYDGDWYCHPSDGG